MESFLNFIMPIFKTILFALVVLVIGLFIIKWLTKKIGEITDRKELDPTLKPFIKSVVNVGLKVLLLVAVISILGIETTSFVALFGAAGLAIGLAFQGSLANFAGGVLILTTRPFKVGEYVEAGGHAGTIEAIRILYTDMITLDNKVIRIPNGSLSNESIVNYSEKVTRRVDLEFDAGYDMDPAKVIRILTEIVANHPLALKNPEPFIRMSEHGKSSLKYTVRIWTKNENYWNVYFDMIEQVKQRFSEENITIPYPHMDVRYYN